MDLEGDTMMEGALSSAILTSLEFNDGELALSSEDLAWVDSSLVPDPDVSDGSWDALRDALRDVLSSWPVRSSDSTLPRLRSVESFQLPVEDSDVGVEKDSEKEKADASEVMSKLPFESALLLI